MKTKAELEDMLKRELLPYAAELQERLVAAEAAAATLDLNDCAMAALGELSGSSGMSQMDFVGALLISALLDSKKSSVGAVAGKAKAALAKYKTLHARGLM